jgi:NADPH-dependent 7-cyano-7-deazaguanine reductase QueF
MSSPAIAAGENLLAINALGETCCNALMLRLLKAAIPMSLCVEFLGARRGNIPARDASHA